MAPVNEHLRGPALVVGLLALGGCNALFSIQGGDLSGDAGSDATTESGSGSGGGGGDSSGEARADASVESGADSSSGSSGGGAESGSQDAADSGSLVDAAPDAHADAAGDGGTTVDAAPESGATGSACTGDTQCDDGHCVNQVCCASACTGNCQACSTALTGEANGTCASILAGTPAPAGQCPEVPCGLTGNCGAGGVCEQTADGTGCAVTGSCESGSCVQPASCQPGGAGMTNCGAASSTSCCNTSEVPGGSYDRSYDGLSTGFTSASSPATVSKFRLDAYEVTVGRFRQFVTAWDAGYVPAAGAGKHTHLNQGQGLASTAGGYEGGWSASYAAGIATSASAWNTNLTGGTWTATAGSSENLPIVMITWYEAYAFCIWDGGFLASEAEWNFAAAGGGDQRAYPWSAAYPPGSTAISCSDANYAGCTANTTNAVGTESPAGDGKWGQSDLAGNVWEWTLDAYATYAAPCADCADATVGTVQVARGGGYQANPATTQYLLVSFRGSFAPGTRYNNIGTRCARAP
jgi:formylglycine-generating enzyme